MSIEEVRKRNELHKELRSQEDGNTINFSRITRMKLITDEVTNDIDTLLSIIDQQDLFIKKVSTGGSPNKTVAEVSEEWFEEANGLLKNRKPRKDSDSK